MADDRRDPTRFDRRRPPEPIVRPIVCPWCQHPESRVLETRDEPLTIREQLNYSGLGKWRKRRCEACGGTFSSEECVTGRLDPPLDPPPVIGVLPAKTHDRSRTSSS